MPGIGPAAGAIAGALGTFFTSTSAIYIAARMVTAVAISSLIARKMAGYDPGLQARAITARDTVAPQLKVYGEALVSGPLMWNDVSGNNSRLLWSAIPVAGHQVESITDIWLDDEVIPEATIGAGAAGGGAVSSGTFGPQDGKDVVRIWKHLGTSTQAADANLVAEFAGWTSAHRARGIAYIVCRFDYFKESEKIWNGREPTNIRALVRGAKIYDPRQDVTQPGVIIGSQDRNNPATWSWSDNPALCAADYLRDSKYGMGLDESRIDWPAVMSAADYCDATVSIPGGTEKRYTCNGTISGTETHRANLENILSSCNGEITVSAGLWTIRVAEYQAPAQSYTADDVIEPIGIHANLERGERVNTLKAQFVDKDDNQKIVESPPVYTTALRDRDNGQILEGEIVLPMTTSFYMAQRIAWIQLHVLDQEQTVSTKLNLKAGASAVGERVNLTVDELGWSPKVFKLMNWSLQEGDELGIAVELREDSSSAYSDPAVGNYATRNAAGVLTFGDPALENPPTVGGVAALNENPSFTAYRQRVSGPPAGLDMRVPQSWFVVGTSSYGFQYDDPDNPGIVSMVPSTGTFMVSSAIRANPDTSYEIAALAQIVGLGAGADFQIYAFELDQELREGELGVGPQTMLNPETELMGGVRNIVVLEEPFTDNTWTDFVDTYTPTATAKFFSIGVGFANESGFAPEKHLIQRVIVRESSTRTIDVQGDPSSGFIWNTHQAGGWSPADTTLATTVRFFRGGSEIASRVINATLTDSGVNEGDIALAAGTSTGEATTVSVTNNNTPNPVATVTHTASGKSYPVIATAQIPGYSGGISK